MPDIVNLEALKEMVRQIVKEELAKAKVEETEVPKPMSPTPPFSAPIPPPAVNPVAPTVQTAGVAQNQPPDMPIG